MDNFSDRLTLEGAGLLEAKPVTPGQLLGPPEKFGV